MAQQYISCFTRMFRDLVLQICKHYMVSRFIRIQNRLMIVSIKVRIFKFSFFDIYQNYLQLNIFLISFVLRHKTPSLVSHSLFCALYLIYLPFHYVQISITNFMHKNMIRVKKIVYFNILWLNSIVQYVIIRIFLGYKAFFIPGKK